MKLFKNYKPKEGSDRVNTQLAIVIANRLIKSQHWIAQYLNTWFNAYSINQKKWMLLCIGSLVSVFLIAGIFSSFYSIPLIPQNNYSSAHIGMASGIPERNFNKHQLTDSSTIKK